MPEDFQLYGLIFMALVITAPLAYQVVRTNFKDNMERRRAPRFKIINKKEIQLLIQGNTFNYQIIDISQSGMSFVISKLPKNYEFPKELDLAFSPDNSNEVIGLSSFLIYIRPLDNETGYRIGVKFKKAISETYLNLIKDSNQNENAEPLKNEEVA